jgi:hypothetical protein
MRRLLRRLRRSRAAEDADRYTPGAYADDGNGTPPIEPFVPVSGSQAIDAYDEQPARRRVRLPRVRVPRLRLGVPRLRRPTWNRQVRFDILLLAVLLIAAGIFGMLLNLGRVEGDAAAWWPLVIVAGATVWMLVALLRRQVTPFLGASALTGIGLSLLLDTQDIASFRETLMGVVLVAVGLGIVIRGFLLRQQTPA